MDVISRAFYVLMGFFFGGFCFFASTSHTVQFARTRSRFTWLSRLHVCCFCFLIFFFLFSLPCLPSRLDGQPVLSGKTVVLGPFGCPSLFHFIFLCQSKGEGGADNSLVLVSSILHCRGRSLVYTAVPSPVQYSFFFYSVLLNGCYFHLYLPSFSHPCVLGLP